MKEVRQDLKESKIQIERQSEAIKEDRKDHA